MNSNQQFSFLVKPTIFLLSLAPAIALIVKTFNDDLGANPVETLTHETGEWALRLLWITLMMTPLRMLTGWTQFIRLRRMFGLFAFFYVCSHFSIYLLFDHFFDWAAIGADIIKRPYITVGFAAFILLMPLAITSNRAMMRRLGKRWQLLHRLIYVIALLAILHFIWLVKADLLEPLIYAAVLLILFGFRVKKALKPASRTVTAA